MALPEHEAFAVQRRDDDVVVITLSRPERLNALTIAMFDHLRLLCEALGSDPTIRAVILTGAGRGFCAGLDLDEAQRLPQMSVPEMLAAQERVAGGVAALRKLPIPVIAAVNGAAAGGGFGLALAADLRVAGPGARFNAAFVRIGLSGGDVGVSWLLPRIVGLGVASEILLTGRILEIEEAQRVGLVNHVVAASELLDTALALAGQIARNSPFGMRLTKQVLQVNVDAPSLDAAIELENRNQTLTTRTADMAEALAAFREQREPTFTGR